MLTDHEPSRPAPGGCAGTPSPVAPASLERSGCSNRRIREIQTPFITNRYLLVRSVHSPPDSGLQDSRSKGIPEGRNESPPIADFYAFSRGAEELARGEERRASPRWKQRHQAPVDSGPAALGHKLSKSPAPSGCDASRTRLDFSSAAGMPPRPVLPARWFRMVVVAVLRAAAAWGPGKSHDHRQNTRRGQITCIRGPKQ